ncbi:MAG TPA: hypothetical protein DD490_27225 [Acidobacteria bacterium]|nr:hypothetical protein [Acidobacteriota bacterium]
MAGRSGVLDALIVGGGPAGAATALALAREGWTVRLVEGSSGAAVRVGETVPPEVRIPLQELGLWERFLAQDHLPSVGNASVWGGSDLGRRDFAFHPYGPGWHLDRGRFDAMLTEAAEGAGAELARLARIVDAVRSGDVWRVTVRAADGLALWEARALVDATGRSAALVRKLGGRRRWWDRMVAVLTCFAPGAGTGAPDAEVLLEAVEDGWWYSAPLPDGSLVTGFFTDADLCGDLHQDGWLRALARTGPTRERLRGRLATGAPVVRSAATVSSDPFDAPAFLAVGDAALACDPLSSQGIVKGMSSGLRAAAALLAERRGRRQALEEERNLFWQGLAEFLGRRASYYGLETRWPASRFWTRRNPGLLLARRLRENPVDPAEGMSLSA